MEVSVEVELKRKTTTVKSRSKRATMKGYFLCVMKSIFSVDSLLFSVNFEISIPC